MRKALILIAFAVAACSQKDPTLQTTTIEGLELTFIEPDFSDGMTALEFISESTGVAGTGDGKLFKTKDGGKTWKELFNSTHLYVTDFYFANDKEGWAIGEKGVVLQTTNGGDSWHPAPAKPDGVFDDQNIIAKGDFDALTITDDLAFASKKNEIYRSSDLGKSWTALHSFNYPGTEFHSLNFASDQMGFAFGAGQWTPWSGSKHGRAMASIFYTNDGGQTWKGSDEVYEIGPISTANFLSPALWYALSGGTIVRIRVK